MTLPPINEPTLGGKLEESLTRTHELDSVLCVIAERVFGYQDSNEANDGPEETKGRPYQPHTIEMALTISERLAMSVGFARTILTKDRRESLGKEFWTGFRQCGSLNVQKKQRCIRRTRRS